MRVEKKIPFVWPSEAALCQEFVRLLPPDWVSYNESCGFDMVLHDKRSGAQIGVEAKLVLNSKVLMQAIEGMHRNGDGPDFRAVLVGRAGGELTYIARRLGVTVVMLREEMGRHRHWEWQGPEKPSFKIFPELPAPGDRDDWWCDKHWSDLAPISRLKLPDYIPDVDAGHPAPLKLSEWKIKAIKTCIFVERNDRISRATFKALSIDPSRWMDGRWLEQTEPRGFWRAGPYFPGPVFRREHPANFAQIEAEYETWAKEAKLILPEADTLFAGARQ